MKNRIQGIVAGLVSTVTSLSLLLVLSSCSDGVVLSLKDGEEMISELPYISDPSQTLPSTASPETTKTIRWLVEPKYDEIQPFYSDYCIVSLRNETSPNGFLRGVINTAGEEVISCKYVDLRNLGDGFFFANGVADEMQDGTFLYSYPVNIIDKDDNIIINLVEDGDRKKEVEGVFYSGESFLINYQSDDFIAAIYDLGGNAILEEGSYAAFLSSGEDDVFIALFYGEYFVDYYSVLINSKGSELSSRYDFSGISEFQEGLACVEKGNKFGFIDSSFNEVIDPIYDKVLQVFKNGRAVVYSEEEELYHSIDKQGNKIESSSDANSLMQNTFSTEVRSRYDGISEIKHGGAISL